MRGFFCEPRKPFFPILKRKIFLGIFGWKLLSIKKHGVRAFLFFMVWADGLQIREIEDFFKFFNFGKVLNFAEVLFAEVLFPGVLFAEVKFPQFSGDKI